MATRRLPKSRKTRTAAAGSWLALLAATTLGDAADTLRAEVRADRIAGLADGSNYRLVVQSFDDTGRDARPVGSMQRSVTADELRNGVHVSLLELREAVPLASQAQHPRVVAWIESGEPDLEFDGRRARPSPGSVYGVAKRGSTQARPDGVLQISLNRKA